MEPLWVGPYKVIEILGKGPVKLENIKSCNTLKNVYNIANLKRYTHVKSPKSDVVKDIIKKTSHLRSNTLQSKKAESGCDFDLIEIQHPKSTRILDLCAGRVKKRGLRDPQLAGSCGLVHVFLLSLFGGKSSPPIVTMYHSTVRGVHCYNRVNIPAKHT